MRGNVLTSYINTPSPSLPGHVVIECALYRFCERLADVCGLGTVEQ